MAETVKRRIAAARLAVAFVAAGTIAGAAAWAQADPPPAAQSSAAVDYFLKNNVVDSSSILNGSLLFKDFKKGQIPSALQFHKLQRSTAKFHKLTNTNISAIKGELNTHKAQIDGIKGELSSFVKLADADARYLKLSDSVVRGDGSVFTESALLANLAEQRMLSISGLVDVDANNGPSPHMKVTNTSGGPLTHTSCGNTLAGVIQPGQSFSCPSDNASQTIQLIGAGANPIVATLSFSGIPAVQGGGSAQFTTQILIGL